MYKCKVGEKQLTLHALHSTYHEQRESIADEKQKAQQAPSLSLAQVVTAKVLTKRDQYAVRPPLCMREVHKKRETGGQ